MLKIYKYYNLIIHRAKALSLIYEKFKMALGLEQNRINTLSRYLTNGVKIIIENFSLEANSEIIYFYEGSVTFL